MLVDRQMQSPRNFTGGFPSWLPATCKFSTRRSFDHHGKGSGNFVQKKCFEKWKKVVSLIDLKEMKTRNDCEIACDCVKRATVVLHVGLCKEIFARKHTATHKPTSAQPLTATSVTSNKIASRSGAPRPPLTDVGTEIAFRQSFRLDQRKHFRKSKHLLRSEVSWCDVHLRRSTWHHSCTSE